jgi:hypothetical protein
MSDAAAAYLCALRSVFVGSYVCLWHYLIYHKREVEIITTSTKTVKQNDLFFPGHVKSCMKGRIDKSEIKNTFFVKFFFRRWCKTR